MNDIAEEESQTVAISMDDLIEDLGVCPLPDASPGLKEKFRITSTASPALADLSIEETPPREHKRKFRAVTGSKIVKARKRLLSKYSCMRRSCMSCAVDTAWQKRGFDSLTSRTFFMSKACYGKKVVKSSGSARLMESVSGEKGVMDLASEGTPVEYLEGDGDTTLIARLKNNQNISMKKCFDKNHIIKNIGKSLYALQSEKGIKISKNTIGHFQKCISYALSKNSGDVMAYRTTYVLLCLIILETINYVRQGFCGQLKKKGK